jgi:spore germination cell wall hydrolase CwlJ-like protein
MIEPVLVTDVDLDILALTLWGECRGESELGQRAVSWVIRNRLAQPGWWSRNVPGYPDDTVAAVCRDRAQFSCWNPSDPQYARITNPHLLSDARVQQLRVIGAKVMADTAGLDPTKGSTHYCVTRICRAVRWARGRVPQAVIGNHSFYKIGLGA